MNKVISTIISPKFFLGLILSVAGIWWAFYDFEYHSFIEALSNSKTFYILIATVILMLSVWIRAIRWKYLLFHEKNISTAVLCKAELIGYFGNNVLPLRLGEILRSVILGKEEKLPKSLVFGSVMLERILDMVGLITLAIVLIYTYPVSDIIRKFVYTGTAITFSIILILIFFRKIFQKKLIRYLNNGILGNIMSGISGLKPELRAKSLVITILLWMMYWFNTHLIQAAFNLEMTISESLLVLVVSSLALSIPSAPGMIGTYHLAVNYAMEGILEFPSEIANPYTIVMHAYGFISLTLVGAYYFMQNQYHSQAFSEIQFSQEFIRK